MAVSDDDLDLMRRCVQEAVKDGEMVSRYFHEALFSAAPETRQLYRMDLDKQGELLLNGVGMILAQMHDVEALRPFVADMARRHVDYGVKPEHYPLVREALLTAFKRLLGTRFTPEAEAAWIEAYDNVAAIMIDIAYGEDSGTSAH